METATKNYRAVTGAYSVSRSDTKPEAAILSVLVQPITGINGDAEGEPVLISLTLNQAQTKKIVRLLQQPAK